MSDVSPLEPVDTERCQCERNTYNPFIMGGPVHHMVRCSDRPTTVVTESEPDDAGQQGAMSLCTKHLCVFVIEKGRGMVKFRLKSVEDWIKAQESEEFLESIGI